MKFYRIANLDLEINENASPVLKDYEYDFTSRQIIVMKNQDYVGSMIEFMHLLLEHDGFCFHASCLMCDGEGLLFSANKGVGKSTHAALWRKYMSEEHDIVSINDDKPVIRKIDGVWKCFGSPWAGKHHIQSNTSAPVKALIFLKQGSENKIRKVSVYEALPLILSQCLFDKMDREKVLKILDYLDSFLKSIDIYELECTISKEACELVYQNVWRIDHEN